MDRFEDWCRKERSRLQRRLQRLEAGSLKLAHDEGAGWVDQTAERTAEIFRRMSELDEVLGGGASGRGD